MRLMRRTAGALLVLVMVGCGEQPLAREDEDAVADALGNLSFYCSERLYAKQAPRDVQRLIAIYRRAPDDIYQAGHEEEQDMRGVLESTARNLRSDRCDPGLAARIEREL